MIRELLCRLIKDTTLINWQKSNEWETRGDIWSQNIVISELKKEWNKYFLEKNSSEEWNKLMVSVHDINFLRYRATFSVKKYMKKYFKRFSVSIYWRMIKLLLSPILNLHPCRAESRFRNDSSLNERTRQVLITRRNRFPFDCKSVCFHFATFFRLRRNLQALWRMCWRNFLIFFMKHDKLILQQVETDYIFEVKPR